MDAWEEIIKRNGEATNNLSYDKYLNKCRQHARLSNEYIYIKGALMFLLTEFDTELINELNIKGYRIYNTPTENKEEDTSNYTKSILAASKRVENLRSKILSVQYEMNEYTKALGNKKTSFNHIIGGLIFELPGLSNPEDIKLAVYNELVSRIKQKNKIGVPTK